MIHTFTCLDRHFLFDVDTCSLFEVDELAAQLAPYVDRGETPRLPDADPSAVAECLAEFAELKRQGIAFTHKDWDKLAKRPESGELKAMCLHISHDCELRCKYCFAGTGNFHGRREVLSLETGKLALEFLCAHSGSRSILEVDFFGGEPLLNWETAKAIMAYGREVLAPQYHKAFRFTVTTNGMGLTDEVIQDFEQMYNVVVSIDGRKDIHDGMRPDRDGQPTFDRIVENAKRFREKRGDKSYYIRGTYTHLNLDFSKDVLAIADMGFDQVSMEPVVLPDSHFAAIRPEDIPVIEKEYEELAKAYVARRKVPESWFNFFHFMIDLEAGPCITKRLTGCGAGNEYIAVTPNGDIYPCHQFAGNQDYVMGNVHDGTFNREMQYSFSKNHVLNKPDCRDCWCKFFCSGGCIANSVNFTGDMMKPVELSCALQKKRTECALAIYSVEHAGKN